MSGEQFTRRWLYLIAALAILIVASPFVVALLVQNSACFGSEHACSDMAGFVLHYGRALILVVTLVPLLVSLAGRSLTVGVFAWAFPFALVMVAGALPLLLAIGGPEVGSMEQAVAHPGFVPLLFFLVLLLPLSIESEDGVGGVWKLLMPVIALGTLFFTSATWLPGFAMMPYLGTTAGPLESYLGQAHSALGIGAQVSFVNSCLLVFVLAAAGMMMSARSRRA